MHAIADTDRLVADGIITEEQAREIHARAREGMIKLGINSLLSLGIIAATAGLIFWLASPVAVAVCGTLALIAGALILVRGSELFRMFGNASALIGAGMLIGGAAAELVDKHEEIAGWVMLVAGTVVALIAGWMVSRPEHRARFVTGAILLMGLAMHLTGLGYLLSQHQVSGAAVSLFYLYFAGIVVAAGWLTNVRFVTAFAIVPFAQALDTGTFYFHAGYAFYSPETTLSIIQMGLLIGACLWLAKRVGERTARHAIVLAIMAFVVANLCALVGSLWGDTVGETIWGPGRFRGAGITWEEHQAAVEAFREHALVVSAGVYSVLWAIALAGMVFWAAQRNQRGLFNAAMTFAAIHVYTQFFESFSNEPLAYVVAGLAAIPLAWGIWRLNHWMTGRISHGE